MIISFFVNPDRNRHKKLKAKNFKFIFERKREILASIKRDQTIVMHVYWVFNPFKFYKFD